MTTKLTASPEVIQTCREVAQTMTTDVNQDYISGLTEGLKLGVLFMFLVLLFLLACFLMNIITDRYDRKIERLEKLQQSSEAKS